MQKHVTDRINIVLVLLLVATGALLPGAATASVLTVVNTNASGVGSLRQVVADAAAGDTINFATNVTGAIRLTNGPVAITQNLSILGPGALALAISSASSSNLFNVSSGVVLIADLTLKEGSGVSGAGVRLTGGTLTLSNCIVSDNFAAPGQGGVGGGVSATGGTLAVINSTFRGNRANLGGGIYNNGAQVTLTHCTFTANDVNLANGSGAAIYNNSTLTILSCTIASNIVTSGAGFGGGIRNLGTLHLRNSIVAGNSATTGPDLEGAFVSDGYNLIGNGAGFTGLTNGVNNDLVGTNARLGALQDNGGPTPTMALRAGSPAIDQGVSGGLTTDQRGQSRLFDHILIPNAPGGDGADIGACEATFVVVNTNDSGPGSLRQALQDNNVFGGNTISFSSAVNGMITLASALEITNAITISGPGAKVLTVSGNNANRVFGISSGPVSISDLTVANGNSGIGAGVYAFIPAGSLLTIQNCVFTNNNATSDGGALYCQNPSAILNSTFRNNRASGGGGGGGTGGAIYGFNGLGITNCTFVGNVATNTVFGTGRGGAIANASGFTYIYACTILSNTAAMSGGGVAALSFVYVRNSIIARNTAPTDPDTYGNFGSQGYNLIGNSGSTTGWSAGNGDQVGSGGFPVNPLLGPLQDNGGPTPTMSPLPGSPAIDKGKTGASVTDQRGRTRPFEYVTIPNATGGDASDIGAAELSPDSPHLNIQRAGSAIVLSWSTNAFDFRLQSATNLAASNNWATVAGAPVIMGNQYHLTNGAPTGSQFYRLIYP